MSPSRRDVVGGLLALGGCAPRNVANGNVLAAGQPAALLIYALAPRRLLGWPRRPLPAALALLPPAADLPELGALTGGGGRPVALEAVVALRPALMLDYGDVGGSYRALAERLEGRVGAPYRLLDGTLDRTPQALIAAGALLGVEARARRLADMAETLLALPRAPGGTPSFYYARGRDGLETGFAGSLATQVLERGDWTNVATGAREIGRVPRELVAAWNPEVIVTLDATFARVAAADPFWRQRRGGGERRLLLLPDLPFGWIDRPPSVNRLLGCAWLGHDERVAAEAARRFVALFYGVDARGAARMPMPRWIA